MLSGPRLTVGRLGQGLSRKTRWAGRLGRVAKKYSIDQASKSHGGKLPGVATGQQEKALDAAVFRGKERRLTGPVKTQLGYYVFEVSKIAKASQQTPEQAKPTIKQLVISERRQKALDEFTKKFREKWRQRTKCQDGFVTQDCSNGPKPAATPAARTPRTRARCRSSDRRTSPRGCRRAARPSRSSLRRPSAVSLAPSLELSSSSYQILMRL